MNRTLASEWSLVGGFAIHARVDSRSAPVDAPSVVLVHGLGVSSRYMVPTAVRLAPSFRVYAPDLPGFGKSAKPRRALDVPGLADALLAWLDARGLERPSLVANSLGCQVAVDLAVRHRERVARLVLVGPTVDPGARDPLRQIGRLLLDSLREPPSLLAIIARDYAVFGPRRFIETARYALRDRIEDKLPSVAAPTIVACGSRDGLVSPGWCDAAARLLPAGRLVVVPGAAHALNYNAPAPLVRAITPFLLGETAEAPR